MRMRFPPNERGTRGAFREETGCEEEQHREDNCATGSTRAHDQKWNEAGLWLYANEMK
jgi:hypothetical protein